MSTETDDHNDPDDPIVPYLLAVIGRLLHRHYRGHLDVKIKTIPSSDEELKSWVGEYPITVAQVDDEGCVLISRMSSEDF